MTYDMLQPLVGKTVERIDRPEDDEFLLVTFTDGTMLMMLAVKWNAAGARMVHSMDRRHSKSFLPNLEEDMPKKMADKSCCPTDCPKAGEVYVCDACKMTVAVLKGCACGDCECVTLACCGAPMCKKN